MSIDELCDHLACEAEDGLFFTGGQLYVSLSGEPVVDVALGVDGIGQPVKSDSLFAIYCAAKPVLAVAIGCLIDDGELSLDDRLGDVVEKALPEHMRSLLVQQLLDHTAGLHELNARDYLICSERQRDALVMSALPPPGWRVGVDVAYSEAAAWHVLGWVVEALSPDSPRLFVQRRVVDSTEAGDELFVGGMHDSTYSAYRARLSTNIWLTGRSGDPLLMEQSHRFRCGTNAALASSGSARGLGRFYEGLLMILRNCSGVVARDTLDTLRSIHSQGYDPVMGRECSYGSGFMVDLEAHYFGRLCGSDSFGHSGNGGMTAAFCDPTRELVVAFHFNGRVDAESALMYRRPGLIDKICRAVGADS